MGRHRGTQPIRRSVHVSLLLVACWNVRACRSNGEIADRKRRGYGCWLHPILAYFPACNEAGYRGHRENRKVRIMPAGAIGVGIRQSSNAIGEERQKQEQPQLSRAWLSILTRGSVP